MLEGNVLAQKEAVVKIFNLKGQLVQELQAGQATQLTLQVQGWPKGLYLVQVQTRSGIIHQKLVVK